MSEASRPRVLVTRPAEQAAPWSSALARAGYEPVAYPVIEVGPPPSWAPLDEALARLATYDWIVFTSATAVRFATSRWPPSIAPRSLDSPLVAAVGDQTAAALTRFGLSVARTSPPGEIRGEGLAAALADLPGGTRVLFPQAVGGRADLTTSLRERGCIVDVVPASSTKPIAPLPPPPEFDVATFASPSALHAFLAAHGPSSLAAHPIVAIGPTTGEAAREAGLDVFISAEPTIDALLRIIGELTPISSSGPSVRVPRS